MKLELESPSLTAAQEKLLLRFLDRLENKYETGKMKIEQIKDQQLYRIQVEIDPKDKVPVKQIAVEKTFNKTLNLLAKFIGV